jgi:hypothetical protein
VVGPGIIQVSELTTSTGFLSDDERAPSIGQRHKDRRLGEVMLLVDLRGPVRYSHALIPRTPSWRRVEGGGYRMVSTSAHSRFRCNAIPSRDGLDGPTVR